MPSYTKDIRSPYANALENFFYDFLDSSLLFRDSPLENKA